MIRKIIEAILNWFRSRKIKHLEDQLKLTQHELRSAYIKFGQKIEHLAPFTKNFPDSDKAIFLGQPIDFITFGDEHITFIEVKSGSSMLSNKQKRIRGQIENGKVKFEEIRY